MAAHIDADRMADMSSASNQPAVSFAAACHRAAALTALRARNGARVVIGLPGLHEDLLEEAVIGPGFMNASGFIEAAKCLGAAPGFTSPLVLLGETAMRLEATPQGSLARGGPRMRFPVESLDRRNLNLSGGFLVIGPGAEQASLAQVATRHCDTVWAWGLGQPQRALPESGTLVPMAGEDFLWTRDLPLADDLHRAMEVSEDAAAHLDRGWNAALERALGPHLIQSRSWDNTAGWGMPSAWPVAGEELAFSPRPIEDLVRLRLGYPPMAPGAPAPGRGAAGLPAFGVGFYGVEQNGAQRWQWLGPDAESTFIMTPAWPGWRTLRLEVLSLVPALKATCVRLFWNGALVAERLGAGLLSGPVWVWPNACGAAHTVTVAFEAQGQRLKDDPRLLTACITGFGLDAP
jgi:hypothetical protein